MAETKVIFPIKREDKIEKRLPGTSPGARASLSPGTQARRLGSKLDKAFANILDRKDIDVRSDPSALAPEHVLVFEIIGNPINFIKAAERVGLEWLAEEIAILTGVQEYFEPGSEQSFDDDFDDLDETFATPSKPNIDATTGRYYLGMPTLATFQKLRQLWDRFKANKPAPEKHSDWWQLFSYLHDIRTWGPQDRMSGSARERIVEQLARHKDGDFRIEIDLWYRQEKSDRDNAESDLTSKVKALGGNVIDELRIKDIRYHAALVELAPDVVRQLVNDGTDLITANEVMTIRPQAAFQFSVTEPNASSEQLPDREMTRKGPELAALLDGFPVENHQLLKDRIDVVTVDVGESMAPVNKRYHGTSMASLILHGDLNEAGPVIGRTLKVVPVLAPDHNGFESPPTNQLAIRTIKQAVEDLKDGPFASGPDVIIINHSICDDGGSFAGVMSPWARMLDFLSYKYGVLFVVSSGNVEEGFILPGYSSIPDFRTAQPVARRKAILKAIEAGKALRGMFTPAEAVNGLTVGAVHGDSSTATLPPNLVDPYGSFRTVNLMSGLGLGFAQAVKPDIVIPGGRQIAHPVVDAGNLKIHGRRADAFFGLKAAAPDEVGGKTNLTRRSAGTSNAAALATRAGLLISDALDDAYEGDEVPWHKRKTAPAILKSLIAHSAHWGNVGEHLDEIYPPTGTKNFYRRRENVTRFIGYGQSDINRIIAAGQNRITLLGEDVIRVGKRHTYRIPLPDDLSSRVEFRRVTATLAWLTPVKPQSSHYRAIGLELVNNEGRSQIWSGVDRASLQPPLATAKRGTLLHAVYENEGTAVPFLAGSEFELNVQATSRLSGFTKFDVPYALAVTIEVAATLSTDIRTSLESRILPKIGVR